MNRRFWAQWACRFILAFGIVGSATTPSRGEPADAIRIPTCLEQLQGFSCDELLDLFRHADMGHPLVGVARGRMLVSTDKHMPRFKVRLANLVWRGKTAEEGGYFINRWVGNHEFISSHYVIAPSWIDGRPAVVVEYDPGTALFGNMHDELREIAPGLYLGPLFDRCPCPKFRGMLALQVEAPSCSSCGRH
jgi:hypothetical protein